MAGVKPDATLLTDRLNKTISTLKEVIDDTNVFVELPVDTNRDSLNASVQKPKNTHLAFVKAMIDAREKRKAFFPDAPLGEPAWDILLDLYHAALRKRAISVSSVCLGANVPATTALRYIAVMTDSGLLVRVPDDADGRRVFIELSEGASTAIGAYIDWRITHTPRFLDR